MVLTTLSFLICAMLVRHIMIYGAGVYTFLDLSYATKTQWYMVLVFILSLTYPMPQRQNDIWCWLLYLSWSVSCHRPYKKMRCWCLYFSWSVSTLEDAKSISNLAIFSSPAQRTEHFNKQTNQSAEAKPKKSGTKAKCINHLHTQQRYPLILHLLWNIHVYKWEHTFKAISLSITS